MLLPAGPKEAMKPAPKLFDVLIVGGGLSGLMVAHEIHHQLPSLSWRLLEARQVLGGRLTNDSANQQIDLGGAWIWPLHQPYMKRLSKTLNLPTFQQPDDPSSTRIAGGAVQLIHQMAEKLPDENLVVDTPVISCSLIDEERASDMDRTASGGAMVKVDTVAGTFLAKRVVLAVPPRLASKHITFHPELSREKQRAMSESQTWMAGVTKVALVYPKKFWSADVSNMGFPAGLGPAFQVYDASTENGSVSALTFFTLVPQGSEAINDNKVLASECANQMQTIWNYFREKDMARQAKSYTGYHVQRWPTEKYISEDEKPSQINPHPQPVRALSEKEWDGRLLFAGSETDRMSPGVMEGAVSAAMRVVQDLKNIFK